MKTRRMLSLLAAMLLVLSIFSCAQAQISVTGSYTIEGWSVEMNLENGVLYGYNRNGGGYALLNPDGTPITSAYYGYMYRRGEHFEVVSEDGLNVTGLIDKEGNMVMPQQYGDVVYISDRWQIGVKLVEATVENYDYTGSGNTYYLVDAYDVYYCGALVRTLGRLEYDMAEACGSFLYMRDREGNYHYYNSAMQESGYVSDYPSYSEYENTSAGYFHRGSGQQAFVPGCTLTYDDVKNPYQIINGRVVDVQGNELGYLPLEYGNVHVYGFDGDYCKIKANDKYGVIDKTGRAVIPCEYDDIGYSEPLMSFGCQIVTKDGKLGYVDVNGNVTCEFKYSENVWDSDYKTPLNFMNDLEGNVIVLSGAVGELPERYAEVYVRDGCPLFSAVKADGTAGVVDMYGQTVVPFSAEYDDTYDFTLANDGSVVLAYGADRVYKVYTLGYGQAAEAASTGDLKANAAARAAEAAARAAETASGAAPETEAAPAAPADDSWICICGEVNTGKFCAACGGARPFENEASAPADDSWTCTCGSVNTGNFCPNCGAGRPAEKLVCAGCGYEPEEGTTPKFCVECGTAF